MGRVLTTEKSPKYLRILTNISIMTHTFYSRFNQRLLSMEIKNVDCSKLLQFNFKSVREIESNTHELIDQILRTTNQITRSSDRKNGRVGEIPVKFSLNSSVIFKFPDDPVVENGGKWRILFLMKYSRVLPKVLSHTFYGLFDFEIEITGLTFSLELTTQNSNSNIES